jgi:hypothetical protein
MKRKAFVTVLLIIAFALVFTGCDNGSSSGGNPDPKSLKIEDIVISDLGETGIIVGLKRTLTDAEDWGGFGYVAVSGSGTVTKTIQLKNRTAQGDLSESNWTGSGQYYILVWESSDGDMDATENTADCAILSRVTFSVAETPVAWGDFSAYDTDPKTLKITDVESSDLGGESGIVVMLFDEATQKIVAGGYETVSGSETVTFELKKGNETGTGFNSLYNWTGLGTYYIFAVKSSGGSFGGPPDWGHSSPVTFSVAQKTVAWGDFVVYTDESSTVTCATIRHRAGLWRWSLPRKRLPIMPLLPPHSP